MKTIRAKLMLIMLASTFVITIVLSIVAIRSINRSTEGTLRSSVEPLTVQASRSFDTTMRQYTTNFSTSAKSALFAEKENVNDMLNILKSGFSSGINEYCSFTVFAEDGSILVTDSKELAELTPQEEVEDAASKSSVVITDLMPLNNKIYFTIFQSATANGRKVVAAVTINAEVLNNLILVIYRIAA